VGQVLDLPWTNLAGSYNRVMADDASPEPVSVPAGNFSEWLRGTAASLRSGKGGTAVPCGSCTACCRSSMFIHIGPDETQTIQRIPRALLFPAPGLPKGHVLMGYSDKGHCPMLVDDKCSSYEHRPRTCRNYDCRVFTATGVPVDRQTQAEIAQRVEAWVFNYESEESREEQRSVKDAATFLQNHRDLFPPGSLPAQPAQLAALAVRIYKLFSGASPMPDTAIAQAIMTVLSEPEGAEPDQASISERRVSSGTSVGLEKLIL
jgi:Fe-S-cluster containining protein